MRLCHARVFTGLRLLLPSFLTSFVLLALVQTGLCHASPARHIAAGEGYACAVGDSGVIQCWGNNDYGKLGNGSDLRSTTPVIVGGMTNASVVATGKYHGCAIDGGTVRCWGYNGQGQLGNDSFQSSPTSVPVIGITNAIAVAAGDGHSCAVLADGTVKCWGDNTDKQLGTGSPDLQSAVPATVTGITNATAVALGAGHSCALVTSGQVYCWGYNGNGEVGNGSSGSDDVPTPALVSGLSNVSGIDAGAYFTCARLNNGQARCWGNNDYGKLGTGSSSPSLSTVPLAVFGIDTATALSTGRNHACAVLADHTVRCWGYNDNQELGNGSTSHSPSPVVVSGLNDAQEIAAGDNFTCVTTTLGGARCWGHNGFGQLGNGLSMDASTPTDVVGLTKPIAIAASRNNTCAIIDLLPAQQSIVKCWGRAIA